MGDFSEKVFRAVCQVPCGKVATYGQIARMIGSPRSARYVGFALRANPEPGMDPGSIPCHRIVFRDGSLCKGFAFGGPEVQKEMLEAEGVTFVDDDHIDLDVCQWDGISSDGPTAPPIDFDWKAELGE